MEPEATITKALETYRSVADGPRAGEPQVAHALEEFRTLGTDLVKMGERVAMADRLTRLGQEGRAKKQAAKAEREKRATEEKRDLMRREAIERYKLDRELLAEARARGELDDDESPAPARAKKG